MELSKRTIEILKNFSTINKSIVVTAGNKLKTLAVPKNIVAEADVEETFSQDFAIYNLNEFLAAVSLYSKPHLTFTEKYVQINEDGSKRGGIKYFYSNPALIVHPTKNISVPNEIDCEFVLDDEALSKVNRASSILGVKDLVVVGDSEGIFLVVQDKKNDSSNDFEIQVSEEAQENFKFYLKVENMKLIGGDYNAKISSRGIAVFERTDGTMSYAVALEAE